MIKQFVTVRIKAIINTVALIILAQAYLAFWFFIIIKPIIQYGINLSGKDVLIFGTIIWFIPSLWEVFYFVKNKNQEIPIRISLELLSYILLLTSLQLADTIWLILPSLCISGYVIIHNLRKRHSFWLEKTKKPLWIIILLPLLGLGIILSYYVSIPNSLAGTLIYLSFFGFSVIGIVTYLFVSIPLWFDSKIYPFIPEELRPKKYRFQKSMIKIYSGLVKGKFVLLNIGHNKFTIKIKEQFSKEGNMFTHIIFFSIMIIVVGLFWLRDLAFPLKLNLTIITVFLSLTMDFIVIDSKNQEYVKNNIEFKPTLWEREFNIVEENNLITNSINLKSIGTYVDFYAENKMVNKLADNDMISNSNLNSAKKEDLEDKKFDYSFLLPVGITTHSDVIGIIPWNYMKNYLDFVTIPKPLPKTYVMGVLTEIIEFVEQLYAHFPTLRPETNLISEIFFIGTKWLYSPKLYPYFD